MNWRSIEVWLGRGLWLFVLILVVSNHLIPFVTGVSPMADYSLTGLYITSLAAISLTISLVTMIFK